MSKLIRPILATIYSSSVCLLIVLLALPSASYAASSKPLDSSWASRQDLATGMATGVPNASPGSALTSFVWAATNAMHVFYIGTDNHVHELWFQSGNWHHYDPTAGAGALNAKQGSALTSYVWAATNTQHVDYIGTDNHVHELWSDTHSWYRYDPTAATGAPNASSGSALAGYAWATNSQQHVDYIGTDNHVYELWSDTLTWHYYDPTATTGAPNANSGSTLASYVWATNSQQHVDYTGIDNHVYELWSDALTWHYYDPTVATGAPNASPGSALTSFAWDAQGTQQVFYEAADGHVHELWSDAQSWHHNDLMAIA